MKSRKIFSNKTSAWIIVFIVLATVVVPFGNTVNVSAEPEFNYAKALQYSMFMYDANMCGTGVDENSLYN